MRSHLLLCGLTLAVLAACSDDESGTTPAGDAGSDVENGSGGSGAGGKGSGGSSGAGTGGSTSSGGSSGASTGGTDGGSEAGDAGGGPVAYTGVTVVAVPGQNGKEAPLAGVEVCATDATGAKLTTVTCSTTNAKGEYTLELEPNVDVMARYSKDGYSVQYAAVDVLAADIARAPLRMAPLLTDAGADAGPTQSFGWDPSVTLDPAKGIFNAVSVTPSSSPDAGTAQPGLDFAVGVSFSITPAEGDGPFYMDADEVWVSGATSTSGGYGAWFLNLTPGTYTVKATSPTMTCAAAGGNGYGWAQTDGSMKAPVIAGANTQSIVFFCTPNPTDAGKD